MKKLFQLSSKKKKAVKHYETIVNKKPRTGLKPIYKISVFIWLLMISLCAKSQVYVDLGAGAAYTTPSQKTESYMIPITKLAVGYQFGNVVSEGIVQPSLTRKVNAPNYLGVKLGYNFLGIIPSVGYLYDYCNSDNPEMNKWVASLGVKFQRNIINDENSNGNIYGEIMYTKISYQFTVGFNIPF